jgi:hypothetical protein
MNPYTREHPSPRYTRLLAHYRRMHQEGDLQLGISSDRTFPGKSLPPQAAHIKRIIDLTGAKSLLDYGAGKGQQYLAHTFEDDRGQRHESIAAWWGVEVRCYDPGYAPFSALPDRQYDGVISTDVLEHCPEEDIPWVLDEIFGHALRFVFGYVACFPASKHLPNGQNAHCTVKPVDWWRALIANAAERSPRLLYEFRLAMNERGPAGAVRVEKVLGNATPAPVLMARPGAP